METRTKALVLRRLIARNIKLRPSQCCQRSVNAAPGKLAEPPKASPKRQYLKKLGYRPSNRKIPAPEKRFSLPTPNHDYTFKHRRIPAYLGGITLFILSAYCSYLLVGWTRSPTSNDEDLPVDFDPSTRYHDIARTFDSSVNAAEHMLGIIKLRKKLAASASGHVLEVSIGTGRNLEYYDWNSKNHNGVGMLGRDGKINEGKVKSFTAVDKSPQMLDLAHEKFSTLFPGILGVRWINQDASEQLPGPPRNSNEWSGNKREGYDTVVQTMGLCSAKDPVKLLRNMGKCVKDNGRILLLEHGRGTWDSINSLLDRTAKGRAKDFGCFWNRDLKDIIAKSGLEVVTIKRKHFGTTWLIELRRPRSVVKEAKEVKEDGEIGKQGWW